MQWSGEIAHSCLQSVFFSLSLCDYLFLCTSYSFSYLSVSSYLKFIQLYFLFISMLIWKYLSGWLFAQTISSLVSTVHIDSSPCCVSAGLLCGSVHRKGPDPHWSGTAHLSLTPNSTQSSHLNSVVILCSKKKTRFLLKIWKKCHQ